MDLETWLPEASGSSGCVGVPLPWREAPSHLPQRPFWATLWIKDVARLVRCVRIEQEEGTLTVVRGPRPGKLYGITLLWLVATLFEALLASFSTRWSCLSTVDEYTTELAQLEQEASVSPSADLEAEIAQMKDDPPPCRARAPMLVFMPPLPETGVFAVLA